MSNKNKHMGYPYYRRIDNEDGTGGFFNIIEEGLITKIEYSDVCYTYCGITDDETEEEIMENTVECSKQVFEAVADNCGHTARVGTRPHIPPPGL